jgi:hypothetical protein
MQIRKYFSRHFLTIGDAADSPVQKTSRSLGKIPEAGLRLLLLRVAIGASVAMLGKPFLLEDKIGQRAAAR